MITTRSEYGMRAMIELAEGGGQRQLSAGEIARRAQVPGKYLEQILASLKRAGLVLATAGAQGGYRLSRPPSEITAGDIIRAVDGPPTVMACVAETPCGTVDACELLSSCGLRPLWQEIGAAINSVIDGATLDSLQGLPSTAPAAVNNQVERSPDP